MSSDRDEATPPSHWRHNLWTFVKILNVRMRFILLMVVTGLVAAQWDSITAHWERWTRPKHATESADTIRTEYYCPMHPSVVRDEPGSCPICGMPLSRRIAGEKATLPEGVIGRVQLSPYRMQLAGVATSEIGYMPLTREIRAAGVIEPDERRVARIAARFGGRIEKLFVDYTGERVERGSPLAEIYSPDLVSTQQEYLAAFRRLRELSAGDQTTALGPVADAQALVDAARTRLRLWGIDNEQIATLEREGRPTLRMTIPAPIGGTVTRKSVVAGQYVAEGAELYTITDLSQVWMSAYVQEDAIADVRAGQSIMITGGGLADRMLEGRVSFIAPALDPATRTVRVRADVPNPDLALRPGMYVDATIVVAGKTAPAGTDAAMAGMPGMPGMTGASSTPAAPATSAKYICTMCPEVVSDKPGDCPTCGMALVKVETPAAGGVLAVPESAVIDTGSRKIVYLQREEGVFDAMEVALGRPSDGFYPVLSGLAPGDRVVTGGAFLVDAEMRLNPAAAGSYFGATGGPSAGHQH
jgi:membrane fusion protein, copper/silver efflux system